MNWIKAKPKKKGSYLCFMDNGYIKMCYYNGKEWFDMWETTLKGTVKKWQPLQQEQKQILILNYKSNTFTTWKYKEN
jgi:hypothetical protein